MATLVVPKSALQVLEMTLDGVRIRANAEGEVFASQITDAMSEAGTRLGVDRLEVLLVRTVLVRTMESLGESYPAELLQNHETRMRLRAIARNPSHLISNNQSGCEKGSGLRPSVNGWNTGSGTTEKYIARKLL